MFGGTKTLKYIMYSTFFSNLNFSIGSKPNQNNKITLEPSHSLLHGQMSQSLSKECTPLKSEYDSCFNAWLESYLTSGPRPEGIPEQEWVAQRTKVKAKEYDDKCGEVWKAYNACVKVGLICIGGVLEN